MKNLVIALVVLVLLISCKSQKEVRSTTKESSKTSVLKEVSKPEKAMPASDLIKTDVDQETEETISNHPDNDTGIETVDPTHVDMANGSIFDHSGFDAILKQHVTVDGRVNYAAIKKNIKPLRDYITMLNEKSPQDSWSKNDKLAYYMNAYNAMTVDLIVRNYPIESIKDIKKPWEQRYWKIDNKWINLDEIEHKILRKMDEPRIHFGINCASFSCPPLMNEAFIATEVEQQLETLAIQFINDSKRNTITTDRVTISNIFKWFKSDFTQNGDVIDFLNKYSKVKINESARVRYMDYDWNLNE